MRRTAGVAAAVLAVLAIVGVSFVRRSHQAPALSKVHASVAAPATAEASAPAPAAGETLVATAQVPHLAVYDGPMSSHIVQTLDNPTKHGGPLVVEVTDTSGDRLHVLLPERPNGANGWVDRSAVLVQRDPYRIDVDLAHRVLVLSKANAEVLHTTIAVGTPSTPTPPGDYFVTELLIQPNPNGAYGPFAFGLSAFSNVLTDYAGGGGQVGIHGTNEPASIGQAASHGCIRVPNDVLRQIRAVLPLGTPVHIV